MADNEWAALVAEEAALAAEMAAIEAEERALSSGDFPEPPTRDAAVGVAAQLAAEEAAILAEEAALAAEEAELKRLEAELASLEVGGTPEPEPEPTGQRWPALASPASSTSSTSQLGSVAGFAPQLQQQSPMPTPVALPPKPPLTTTTLALR